MRELILYHGTDARFSKFDESLIGSKTDSGMYGKGFYFSLNPSEAKRYGSRVLRVSVTLKKPFELDTFQSVQGKMRDMGFFEGESGLVPNMLGQPTAPSHLVTEILKKHGYDSVITKDVYGNDEYVVFSSESIKILPKIDRKVEGLSPGL